ncbi:hypothetical protein N7495_006326 [Penicillium taxi]|uniref:uncharacterized protein n=1 Tax=Penicillium taxi TaxID=168475 RepID=UPI00254585BF|nr:uncharacterized protein N7495_006326 [Penicillium taxi]KAJ5894635.1 hypothetical protein N7495_006326 [Penicillium taxi]
MDRAISSYTPSIKALAYSRSQLSKKTARNNNISVAIIAMPTTPGEIPLPGIVPEIKAIENAAGLVFTTKV